MTARDGVSQQAMVDAVDRRDGRRRPEVITGDDLVAEGQDSFHDEIQPFKVFMLVFAFVAMFVGSFIINNTFSITVAQRQGDGDAAGHRRQQTSSAGKRSRGGAGDRGRRVGHRAGGRCRHRTWPQGDDGTAFGIDMPSGPTTVNAGSMLVAFVIGVAVTVCPRDGPRPGP